MKRIALLGLACFVLLGCDDDSSVNISDRVTNEFLVGEWNCVDKLYESGYDTKLKKYKDYYESSSGQTTFSYKIVNGILLSKTGDKEAVEVDLDRFYKNLKMEDNRFGFEYVSNRNLLKNSNNKYTFEREMFIASQNDSIGITKSRIKILKVCTRLK